MGAYDLLTLHRTLGNTQNASMRVSGGQKFALLFANAR